MPSVAWLKDNRVLLPTPGRVSMSFDGESATLKITVTSLLDSGRYTCIASNNAGEAKYKNRFTFRYLHILSITAICLGLV